jgi:hypothetical protein
VTSETSSFAFNQRSAAIRLSSRWFRIKVAHRSDVRDKARKVCRAESAWRHRRAGNASLDETVQFRVCRYAPELSAAKTHARYRVAIGAVAGDAVRIVEIESDFHFRLWVLRTDSWNDGGENECGDQGNM